MLLRGQPRSRSSIEQVNVGGIDGEMDLFVRVDVRPAVRAQYHLLLADLDEKLGFGARRLDHNDLSWHAAATRKCQVLGADAVGDGLSVGSRAAVERPLRPRRLDVR